MFLAIIVYIVFITMSFELKADNRIMYMNSTIQLTFLTYYLIKVKHMLRLPTGFKLGTLQGSVPDHWSKQLLVLLLFVTWFNQVLAADTY